MLSKEEIEVLKKIFKEVIQTKEKSDIRLKVNKQVAKFLLNCINSSEQLETKIKDLENIKDMKEAIELANMNIKDFVYFKYRNEQLESNNKKLIEKLEECAESYYTLNEDEEYVRNKEVEEFAQEILEIAKGEK